MVTTVLFCSRAKRGTKRDWSPPFSGTSDGQTISGKKVLRNFLCKMLFSYINQLSMPLKTQNPGDNVELFLPDLAKTGL
jgi:hypothetical protein